MHVELFTPPEPAEPAIPMSVRAALHGLGTATARVSALLNGSHPMALGRLRLAVDELGAAVVAGASGSCERRRLLRLAEEVVHHAMGLRVEVDGEARAAAFECAAQGTAVAVCLRHSSEGDPEGEPRRPHILVVDDDPDVRETVAGVLEDHGFEVSTAANGAVALAAIESGQRPALILLDLMMPVMSGWEFYDHHQRTCPSIPIVVLTASGLKTGCLGPTPVLAKSVGVDELISTVAGAVSH